MNTRHTIYELRDYALQPGQRDVLIDLFEREFVETQEAHGIRVVATFRDIDRPDRFVWMRSFADMEARAAALNSFYTSEAWRTHRSAANTTMIDSDDVLLLHPTFGDAVAPHAVRPPLGAPVNPETLICAATYPLGAGTGDAFAAQFDRVVIQTLRETGPAPFAAFATDHSVNTFPGLPIREKDTVFVTLTRAPNADIAWQSAIARIAPELPTPEVRRLRPTSRSLLQ